MEKIELSEERLERTLAIWVVTVSGQADFPGRSNSEGRIPGREAFPHADGEASS